MQTAAIMSTEKHILDEIGEVAVVDTADIEKNLWQQVRTCDVSVLKSVP